MKKFFAIFAVLLSSNSIAETFTGIVKDVYPLNQGQRIEETCMSDYQGSVIVCRPAGNQYVIVVSVRNTLYKFKTSRQYQVGDKIRVVMNVTLEDE